MEEHRPISSGYSAVLCDRDVDNDVFVRSSFPDTESIGDGDAGRKFAFSLPGKVADAGRLSECGSISAALAQTTFIVAGIVVQGTGKRHAGRCGCSGVAVCRRVWYIAPHGDC